MFTLLTLAGVLLDLLVELFSLFAASAAVAAMVRDARDEWLAAVIGLGVAVAGLAVLSRRIWRRRRVVDVHRGGCAEVSTVTWLHFVFDALWIAAAIVMVHGAQAPVWDAATRAAAVTVLVLAVALCALRVAARVRGTPAD